MIRIFVAAVFATAATISQAGSYDAPSEPPMMPPVVIEEEAASSSAPSAGLVLGLMTIIVFSAAVAN
ncbi:hypothetical protein [Sagittula salina]|uniref:Ferrochelatase n=1 Tax=Sagittula salina TaxID=2820268 RepID=A0A940MLJ6_9RHOB|nr:hypothetical protein [Sagittula salina]MBP0481980.1 hypothetical protein [Sagittula salina]